jgi:hypothetical protein
MNRIQKRQRKHTRPSLEPLEGRALLSAGRAILHHSAVPAVAERFALPKIPSSGPGLPYILRAMQGGAGAEWIALLKGDLGHITMQRFGADVEYRSIGLAAEKPPYLLASYRGRAHDRVAPMVAGAVVLKNDQIELGAIMRGPFTNYNGTDYVVFGINRGAGGSLSPVLPSEPWITADAVVTLAIGPNGASYSGTITDRTTGAVSVIDPRNIQVEGPVVRVLLNGRQLPSQGWSVSAYKFVLWTESQLNPSLPELASIVPRQTMIPIGVETNVSPTMS